MDRWKNTRSLNVDEPAAPSRPEPSGFCRVAHFSQERNASAPYTLLRFQAHLKTEAVDRGHRCFLRLNVCKFSGKQDERILVVGVHVLNDFARSVSQRVGLRVVIFRGRLSFAKSRSPGRY
jgi:hypothetical protein